MFKLIGFLTAGLIVLAAIIYVLGALAALAWKFAPLIIVAVAFYHYFFKAQKS